MTLFSHLKKFQFQFIQQHFLFIQLNFQMTFFCIYHYLLHWRYMPARAPARDPGPGAVYQPDSPLYGPAN